MALDKDVRKALLEARSMTEVIIKSDSNEAETRPRIERMFESLMGYNGLIHIKREHRIHAIGDSDYCDFVIQLAPEATPLIIVEAKKVNVELADKHVKQAASYGINTGCEWILLTNAREWRIYHIAYGPPPQAVLLDSWNLMNDDLPILASKFDLISLKSVKRGTLEQLKQKTNALTAENLLKIILSEPSISMIRRELRRREKIALYPEEIVSGIRRLLNESAMNAMESMKISLARKQKSPVTPKPPECSSVETSQ